MKYFCDYALAAPDILVDRINNTVECAWAVWDDVDDDTFVITVYAVFDDEDMQDEVAEMLEPYLWVA